MLEIDLSFNPLTGLFVCNSVSSSPHPWSGWWWVSIPLRGFLFATRRMTDWR